MEKESVWVTTERDKNEQAAGVEYSRCTKGQRGSVYEG
jgi:hypothetical protein